MFKYIIKSMENVDVMAVLPLVLFVLVFVGTAIQWLSKSKNEVNRMADLPLNDGTL
jgi:hypothetical protein